MAARDAGYWDDPEIRNLIAPGAKPMREFNKPAGMRCPFEKHHKGCSQYKTRPMGCRIWSCRWLTGDDTRDLRRPDRSHYVIDMMPDFIQIDQHDNQEKISIQVLQIWVDPDYPDAHRDPALRAYLERQADDKNPKLALIRFNERDGLVLIPPSWSHDKQWHEIDPGEAKLPAGATWPQWLPELETT
jgi:hypothetical protein